MIKFHECYGSDEVGTGVYLLPSVYCCTFLDKNTKKKIDLICEENNLVIKDSKELYKNQIKKIYYLLKPVVPHKIYILLNKNYNLLETKYGWNDNIKKTFAHFKVFCELKDEIGKNLVWSIDKFCEMSTYQKYFFQIKEDFAKNNFGWIEFKNIELVQYGDQKNLAIAIASIFARQIFEEKKKMFEKKYQLKFPAGSKTSEIIEFAKKFKEKFSFEEFLTIAKKKYKTTHLVADIFNKN